MGAVLAFANHFVARIPWLGSINLFCFVLTTWCDLNVYYCQAAAAGHGLVVGPWMLDSSDTRVDFAGWVLGSIRLFMSQGMHLLLRAFSDYRWENERFLRLPTMLLSCLLSVQLYPPCRPRLVCENQGIYCCRCRTLSLEKDCGHDYPM